MTHASTVIVHGVKQLLYFICFSVAVVVGFTSTSYTVNESDGIATIQVEVLSGSTELDIPLSISLSDGSALGELTVMIVVAFLFQ